MPVKILSDKRLSMGARLILMILWAREPTKRDHRVYAPKAALCATVDAKLNTLNRWTREIVASGWARYEDGSWWLNEEPSEAAA